MSPGRRRACCFSDHAPGTRRVAATSTCWSNWRVPTRTAGRPVSGWAHALSGNWACRRSTSWSQRPPRPIHRCSWLRDKTACRLDHSRRLLVMTARPQLRFLSETVIAGARHLQTTDGRLFAVAMTPERAAGLRAGINLAERNDACAARFGACAARFGRLPDTKRHRSRAAADPENLAPATDSGSRFQMILTTCRVPMSCRRPQPAAKQASVSLLPAAPADGQTTIVEPCHGPAIHPHACPSPSLRDDRRAGESTQNTASGRPPAATR